MKSNALGVVVVRVQVPILHAGHHYLLNSVSAIHKNVLVVIGDTEASFTGKDPLTFEMRAQMVKDVYPNVQIVKLVDCPTDEEWSKNLDKLIGEVMYLTSNMRLHPILYGSRDSFLKHYKGTQRTFELPPVETVSGSDVRASVEVRNTEAFREGVIYATTHRYPVSYQCVDVAPMRGSTILLGRKNRDGGKWRFVGGFVSPKDYSLEAAAERELEEETALLGLRVAYLGSCHIDDFRYPKGGRDALMTALFMVDVPSGDAVAGDDIDEVQWFEVGDIRQYVADEHQCLVDMLFDEIGATE